MHSFLKPYTAFINLLSALPVQTNTAFFPIVFYVLCISDSNIRVLAEENFLFIFSKYKMVSKDDIFNTDLVVDLVEVNQIRLRSI